MSEDAEHIANRNRTDKPLARSEDTSPTTGGEVASVAIANSTNPSYNVPPVYFEVPVAHMVKLRALQDELQAGVALNQDVSDGSREQREHVAAKLVEIALELNNAIDMFNGFNKELKAVEAETPKEVEISIDPVEVEISIDPVEDDDPYGPVYYYGALRDENNFVYAPADPEKEPESRGWPAVIFPMWFDEKFFQQLSTESTLVDYPRVKYAYTGGVYIAETIEHGPPDSDTALAGL